MKIDNCDDITAAEPMLRNIADKSSVSVKFESHGLIYVSGTKVMNFVTPDEYSFIQIDRTLNAMPLDLSPRACERVDSESFSLER